MDDPAVTERPQIHVNNSAKVNAVLEQISAQYQAF